MRGAHSLLSERSRVHQQVVALPRVQASDRKDMSGSAVFVTTLETRTMTVVKNAIEGANSKMLSNLIDGISILAQSHEHLFSIANTTATQLYDENGIMLFLKSADGKSLAKAPFRGEPSPDLFRGTLRLDTSTVLAPCSAWSSFFKVFHVSMFSLFSTPSHVKKLSYFTPQGPWHE